MPAMQPCVLLKYGEMILRGRNRNRFYDQLQRNVRRQLADLGPLELRQRGGALAVIAPEADESTLAERALDILGVTLVHPAMLVERTPEAAVEAAVELLRARPGDTFAIRARRRDKRFRLDSHELASLAGRASGAVKPMKSSPPGTVARSTRRPAKSRLAAETLRLVAFSHSTACGRLMRSAIAIDPSKSSRDGSRVRVTS